MTTRQLLMLISAPFRDGGEVYCGVTSASEFINTRRRTFDFSIRVFQGKNEGLTVKHPHVGVKEAVGGNTSDWL